MEYIKIIEELKDYSPRYVYKVDHPVYIQTHKSLFSEHIDFSPSCIYVGYVSSLPQNINIEKYINLICLDDISLPDIYKNSDFVNLTIIENSFNPIEILNNIADIMIDEASIVSSMQILLNCLYENKGLQSMVDTAYEVFGNPMFINDVAYKILAMSKNFTFDNETLEEEKSLGYIHSHNITSMKKDEIFKKLGKNNYPFYSKQTGSQKGWLFKVIKIQNVEVGAIALHEALRPFRKYDYELLERFSKLISIELEKSDFYKLNKGIMYNYFLNELIDNKINNRKTVSHRLSFLGWKLYSYFQVIFIADLNNGFLESKTERISYEIRQIIADCRWTVYQKNLIVLLNRPKNELLSIDEYERFKTFLNNNGLAAGFSNVYTDIIETPNHYKQAMRGLEVGIYINHTSGIYNYTDYIITYIGQVLSKKHNLIEFCPPAVLILQEYDKKNNTNLLNTLDIYLYYPEDPVLASKELNIHRNTLQYRINKIKELCNLDLSNGHERLKIQLYLKFIEYLKGGWEINIPE